MRKITAMELKSGCDQRADLFARDDADDVALLSHAEDHHGHVVVAAQRYGCGIHDSQVEPEDIVVGDLREACCVRVLLGVSRVDAVDRGGLQKNVGSDLHRAQGSCGIGGEVRISGPGGEDDDAALLEVADGTAPDVGLADLVHLNGAHDTAGNASLFDGVLQGDGVDDGREHPHVVGGDPVHVDGLLGDPAKEVSSSHDDPDLAAEGMNGYDLFGYFVDKNRVDTEATTRGQGFSRELEEDSFVHVRS